MTAIARSKVKIYIVNADTHPSLLASTDIISGEITNYNLSGGESDVESVPAFGGYIDKEKPIEQLELALEVTPNIDSAVSTMKWDAMTRTKETIGAVNVYTLSNAAATASVVYPSAKMIAIEALAGTIYNTVIYNNCNITTFEMDHAADDNRSLNITFKFSPTTTAGKSNMMTASLAATAFPAFSSLNG